MKTMILIKFYSVETVKATWLRGFFYFLKARFRKLANYVYAVYIYLCTIHSNIKVHLKLTQLVASKPS